MPIFLQWICQIVAYLAILQSGILLFDWILINVIAPYVKKNW